MTAHRFCYIIATLVAIVGLAVVLFVTNPDTKAIWGCLFGSLAVFELGHCIDTA